MKTEEFQQYLREKGSYGTPGNQNASALDRLLGRLDPWFYLRMGSIVFSGYRAASRNRFDMAKWAECACAIFRLIEGCGGRIEISGLEGHKDRSGPFVYVANHMSMVETMLLPGAMVAAYGTAAVVVKESLLRYPFFGKILKAGRAISVKREHPIADFRKIMEEGAERLREGASVVIFPQATRRAEFRPAEFNSAGVKLAKRANVPVVPVALKTDFQRNGRFIKDLGRLDRSKVVRFRFGTPLEVADAPKETHRQVVQFIRENLLEWGAVVQEGSQ